MKTIGRVLVVAAAAAVLSACFPFVEPIEPAALGEAVTIASWEAWYAADSHGEPPAEETFSGPFGGTATYDYDAEGNGYSGQVAFSDFVVREGSAELQQYVLTGSVQLTVEYDSELTDFSVLIQGTLIIAPGGGGEVEYEIDLGIAHAVTFSGEDTVAMDGSATGTINGESLMVDFGTEFSGPLPAGP